MEEYRRLYKLYLQKSDSELEEIMNPNNGYTPTAIKAASDVLKFGRADCQKSIEAQGGFIEIPIIEKKENITNNKSTPILLTTIAIILGFIAVIVLISGSSDLLHVYNNESEQTNKIKGNYYDGSGDYFGLIFYFKDENTYICTTSLGNKFTYGTYEIDGNALNLNSSSQSYAAVITDNGKNIMINDSALNKTIDTTKISKYKKIFENAFT